MAFDWFGHRHDSGGEYLNLSQTETGRRDVLRPRACGFIFQCQGDVGERGYLTTACGDEENG